MDHGSSILDGTGATLLETILDGTEEETLFLDPTAATLVDLVEVARDHEGALPTVEVLASGRVVRRVMDDFIVASAAAELVGDGHLELRTVEGDVAHGNATVVTDDAVLSLVSFGGETVALPTDDDGFVADVRETYRQRWSRAEAYDLSTPPISTVETTLSDDVGSETCEDFAAVLGSLETARSDGNGLDEVTVSLLVAAKNERLFYDLSEWGEDVGLASKATFSRVKNDLEGADLIETRKVPVDVGRPRQRLAIADDRLRSASNDQLASVAESILN
jgi:hypothetical protein